MLNVRLADGGKNKLQTRTTKDRVKAKPEAEQPSNAQADQFKPMETLATPETNRKALGSGNNGAIKSVETSEEPPTKMPKTSLRLNGLHSSVVYTVSGNPVEHRPNGTLVLLDSTPSDVSASQTTRRMSFGEQIAAAHEPSETAEAKSKKVLERCNDICGSILEWLFELSAAEASKANGGYTSHQAARAPQGDPQAKAWRNSQLETLKTLQPRFERAQNNYRMAALVELSEMKGSGQATIIASTTIDALKDVQEPYVATRDLFSMWQEPLPEKNSHALAKIGAQMIQSVGRLGFGESEQSLREAMGVRSTFFKEIAAQGDQQSQDGLAVTEELSRTSNPHRIDAFASVRGLEAILKGEDKVGVATHIGRAMTNGGPMFSENLRTDEQSDVDRAFSIANKSLAWIAKNSSSADESVLASSYLVKFNSTKGHRERRNVLAEAFEKIRPWKD